MNTNQGIFDIPEEEFENPILKKIREDAKAFTKALNDKFFENIGNNLGEKQKITFTDSDGTRFVITSEGVRKLDKFDVDHVTIGKKHICPNCRRSVDLQKQTFNKAHVRVLVKAYDLAIKTGQQYVQIQQLHLDSFYYGVMNHLIRFGLAFRNKTIKIDGKTSGVYGIPRKRVSDFLQGNWTVADSYIENPTLPKSHKDKRKMSERRITIDQVPSIAKVREEYGEKLCSYVWTEPDEFTIQDCFE